MESLRTILIVLGILLVAGIYLADWLRRYKARPPRPTIDEFDVSDEGMTVPDEPEPFQLQDSDIAPEEWLGMTFSAQRHATIDEEQLSSLKGLGDEPDDEPVSLSAEPVTETETATNTRAPAEPATVIVLTLTTSKSKPIRGPLLLRALKDAGLYFGDMDIFHYVEHEGSEPLFSVANILEPGRFVLSEMAEFNTPGIALFMSLPTILPGEEALRIMLRKARELGAQLNATLCDGQRQPLSDEMLATLEEKAKQVG